MKQIAIVIKKYLPLSETFIYEQIKNLLRFKALILTEKRENLDLFPYNPIFSLDTLSQFRIFRENLQRAFGIRSKYFQKILLENKVKLVHAHFGFMGIYILPLCEKFKIPLITHFHGFDVSKLLKEPFYLRRLKNLLQKGDLFLVVSESMRKDVESFGCPPGKIAVHYGGIDLNKFKFRPRTPSKDGKIKILMCGRLTRGKGFYDGIKAFEKVYKRHKNIKLNIIGEGEERKRLERLIEKVNLSLVISLLGACPHSQVREEITKSHIFVHPCLTFKNGDKEGIPNVLKEAQASGMPVISTYHGGISEVVENGKSGFLVKEQDVEALSEKLTFLIENPKVWFQFGEQGRKIVEEKFSISKQIKILEEVYVQLLQKNLSLS